MANNEAPYLLRHPIEDRRHVPHMVDIEDFSFVRERDDTYRKMLTWVKDFPLVSVLFTCGKTFSIWQGDLNEYSPREDSRQSPKNRRLKL